MQKEIARNLKRDVAIAQSLGVLEQAPAEVVVAAIHERRQEAANRTGVGGGTDLDEETLAQLEAISSGDPYRRSGETATNQPNSNSR